jgi:hypothetical protein
MATTAVLFSPSDSLGKTTLYAPGRSWPTGLPLSLRCQPHHRSF